MWKIMHYEEMPDNPMEYIIMQFQRFLPFARFHFFVS